MRRVGGSHQWGAIAESNDSTGIDSWEDDNDWLIEGAFILLTF
jgi:hypothetical protein